MSCLSLPRFYHAVSPSCFPSFLSCLSTIFSSWYAVQYCNNDILFKFTDYLTQLLLSVSHSMSCLSPDVPLTCSVSFLLSPPTIVSLAHYSPFDVFYKSWNNDNSLQIHCLPNIASFSVSPWLVSLCCALFMQCLFLAVSLSCCVSHIYTLYGTPTVLQQCTSLQLCCFLT